MLEQYLQIIQESNTELQANHLYEELQANLLKKNAVRPCVEKLKGKHSRLGMTFTKEGRAAFESCVKEYRIKVVKNYINILNTKIKEKCYQEARENAHGDGDENFTKQEYNENLKENIMECNKIINKKIEQGKKLLL